jgi:hypothetical protein
MFGIKLFYKIINYYTRFQIFIKKYIINSQFIKNCLLPINYFLYIVKTNILNYKIEPLEGEWVSFGTINYDYEYKTPKFILYPIFKTNFSNAQYYETIYYGKQKNNSNNVMDLLQVFQKQFRNKIFQTDNSPINIIKNTSMTTYILYKLNSKYISRYGNPLLKKELPILMTPTTFKFLTIEYHHPNMRTPISIELPKEYYLENNEILFDVFILRMLVYQSKNYVFDKNYTIQIFDENFNSVKLTSQSYILLNKDNYVVKYKDGYSIQKSNLAPTSQSGF